MENSYYLEENIIILTTKNYIVCQIEWTAVKKRINHKANIGNYSSLVLVVGTM